MNENVHHLRVLVKEMLNKELVPDTTIGVVLNCINVAYLAGETTIRQEFIDKITAKLGLE